MKHRTFFWFFLPTGLAMVIFIALPLVSIVSQSLFAPHEAVLIKVENCGPFGCTEETKIDQEATDALRAAEPMGRFVGLDVYLDRGHLAVAEVGEAWRTSDGLGEFFSTLFNLPSELFRHFAQFVDRVFVRINLRLHEGAHRRQQKLVFMRD